MRRGRTGAKNLIQAINHILSEKRGGKVHNYVLYYINLEFALRIIVRVLEDNPMSQQGKQEDRHVVWSDVNLDIEDWRDDLKEDFPGLSEDEMIQKMYEINDTYLDDERMNLDIQLSEPILAVADLGLWDGRRIGYKLIESGNIKDCLVAGKDIVMAEWYVDKDGDLRSDQIHHDGTNHVLYRVYKESATPEQRENLEDTIYHGRATSEDITRLTKRLGDEIAQVYGWDIRKEETSEDQ